MIERAQQVRRAHRHRLLAGESEPWFGMLVAARLVASAIAVGLAAWEGIEPLDVVLLLYGPLSTLALIYVPGLRRERMVWLADAAIVLAMVFDSGDWRSPYYPLWLTTLALPAVGLSLRRAGLLAVGAPLVFLAVALVGGPAPGELNLVSSETLAIHLALPVVLVAGLAYAAEVLRQLRVERGRTERLAVERERQRIAWELHDSAKQRVHAAHLLISSVRERASGETAPAVARAVIELESAAADMDTSLAELSSPLMGRPLGDALRTRAKEISTRGGPRIAVHGDAPRLPPLVEAHAYRIGCEAVTNALRHAGASAIDVTIDPSPDALRLRVHDDGSGMPPRRRADAGGLFVMESRAASIGARLSIGPGGNGKGTVVTLELPNGTGVGR
jgi:signal transduction histidine kinase